MIFYLNFNRGENEMNYNIKETKTELEKLGYDFWNRRVNAEYERIALNSEKINPTNYRQNMKWSLTEEQTLKIVNLCRDDHLLIYTFILTALKLVLHKFSQSEKFSLGLPQYLKGEISAENIFLLYGTSVNMDKPFKDELIKTKNDLLEMYAHQKTELHNRYKENQIYDSVNIFYCMRELHTSSQIGNILSLTNNELTLCMNKELNNLVLEFNYASEVTTDTVNALKNLMINTLDAITNQIQIPMSAIEVINAEEKELLNAFNATKTSYNKEMTIVQLFEEQVAKGPDRIATVCKNESLTYTTLNQKANSLAKILKEKGVGRDVIVGIMTERSLEMIVGILGVLKAGGAYLPIDPQYPPNRIKHIIEDSGIKTLCTQNKLLDLVEHNCEAIDLNDDTNYRRDFGNLDVELDRNSLAYVIYTSGTTGNPKGVMLEHKGIVNLVNTFKDDLKINETKKILQFSSVSFDAFAWELYMTLLFGAQLVIPDQTTVRDPELLSKFIKYHHINVITVPPFVANELDLNNSEIELIVTAGSAAKKNMIERLSNKCRYINAYGPTECTICATLKEYDRDEEFNTITIGGPIANYKVCIVDKHNSLLPVGVVGELCIEGDGIARGYLNNDVLTQQKFVPSLLTAGEKMYKTGDLAKWRTDGSIQYLGRTDEQVKIRGYRIEKAEIENRLIEIEGMRQAIVIDKGDDDNKLLYAYYVSEVDYKEDELREEIKRYLPEYMIPSFFIQLTEIPLTPNGKVDISTLTDDVSTITGRGEYTAPQNKQEADMVQIWEHILGVRNIGTKDNFFDLGGNSLQAIKVSSSLREKNMLVSTSDIFIYQNIKDISDNYILRERSAEAGIESQAEEFVDSSNLGRFIPESRRVVNGKYEQFTKEILKGKIVRQYQAAEIQKISQAIGLTKSATKVEFTSAVDKQRLETVVLTLINKEGLLRTTIVGDDAQMSLCEYEPISNMELPYVDLSHIQSDFPTGVLRDIVEDITDRVYSRSLFNSSNVPYSFVLVKHSNKHYTLYLFVNHLIFDGMSSEVVRNFILKGYFTNEFDDIGRESFHDYTKEIKKGPIDINEKEVISTFRLKKFSDASIEYHKNLKSVQKNLRFTKIEFDLEPEISSNHDLAWEFAFNKFVSIYRQNVNVDVLPINILNMSRRVGRKNYFTAVGEFIDIVPYVCEESEARLENVQEYIHKANHNGINFVTLFGDKDLSSNYNGIHMLMEEAKFLSADLPVFNYLGMYEADFNLEKLYDLQEESHHKGTGSYQRGANCYIVGSKLIMFIDIAENK